MKTSREIRYENARSLATDGPAKFAEKIGMSGQQANQIIGPNPKRNIGDNQARLIEDVFDLEVGWLDHEHGTNIQTNKYRVDKPSNTGQNTPLSDEARSLISTIERLDGLGGTGKEMLRHIVGLMRIADTFYRAQNEFKGSLDLLMREDLTDVESRTYRNEGNTDEQAKKGA